MAPSTKTTGTDASTGQDEVDAMFAEQATEDDFLDPDDLLNQVEEEDSEGWVPTEAGEGIAGKVVKVGQVRSDFAADGEDPMVPTVTLQVKDGTKYRVIGYSSVLKRELIEKAPQVGDVMAVKYFGEKILRKGKFAGRPYKHFGLVVKRG